MCTSLNVVFLATDSSRVKAVRGRQTGGRTGDSDGKGSGCVLFLIYILDSSRVKAVRGQQTGGRTGVECMNLWYRHT